MLPGEKGRYATKKDTVATFKHNQAVTFESKMRPIEKYCTCC